MANEPIVIDGSYGEGGGQVLRTAVTLSMCTSRPLTIENIRGGRKKPGLMRSHLAAARAAQRISNAHLQGDAIGSSAIEFTPGPLCGGTYEFDIGSAGSTTLLLQTLMPALFRADTPSTVQLVGGTHNPMAPSYDFIAEAFLPRIREIGPSVTTTLERHGFAPNGGGRWQVHIVPGAQPVPLHLLERGRKLHVDGYALAANIDKSIPGRELERIQKKLPIEAAHLHKRWVTATGGGNAVGVRVEFEHITEWFEAIGGIGLSAERVAGRAAVAARNYLAQTHPVGEHLADQLMLPMVLGAGGSFRTGPLSEHSLTNIWLIEEVLGPHFTVTPHDDATDVIVTVKAWESA